MRARKRWSYIIVQLLSSEKLQSFKLRPSLPPRQGLTHPYLRGKAYGLAGSAQPGPQLSPPTQLPTPESQAEQSGGPLETLERVTVRGRGIHGQEPTYCVHSLTQSITQSLLHTPFPHPYSLVHLLDSNSLTQFFTLFLHAPVFRHVSLLPLNSCVPATF